MKEQLVSVQHVGSPHGATTSTSKAPWHARPWLHAVVACGIFLLVAAEFLLAGPQDPPPPIPVFNAGDFAETSDLIDNPSWPMVPGTTWVYEGDTDEGFERIVVTVSHRTRMVMGVACRIVLDRAYVDGELIEETFDWYAQDSDSNIWYFGEESYEIEDGVVISTEGSWEAGVDGAQPGIVMLVDPRVGDSYRQEYYEGEAEDMAEVSALDATLTLSDGTLHSNALQTLEWTPLDPGAEENKYYVAGIGMVREEQEDGSYPIDLVGMTVDTAPAIDPTNFTAQIDNPYWPMLPGTTWVYEGDTDEGFERIVVTVSHRTRMVMGVACRIVLDRAYVDGELIEETFDWYAQDSDSNIWYFGEESYEIEDGVVISTEGSWEAGVDGAQPGIVMLVDPRVGDSYRQEYYEGEAEDMAEVSALDATLTLSDGTLHSNALQTLEWTPLDPGAEENKYYVAGIGMVREEQEDGSYPIDLVGMTVDTAPAIDPTNFTAQIDNPYWPMVPGTTWVYEGDTDEGFERIVVTVSHRTRMVMGVACRIVLDRAYVDGELIEETFDWYAQDSDSNIWYFGEESYEIEDGVVISTEGSWEAGVDGAQPGIVMLVDPRVGDSYRQEYYEGEAEDMAEVSALDATLTLSDGTLHSNALQTLEWTPLDPGAEENKYYVAGIGMVREEQEDGSYPIDLVGMTVDTAPAIDPTNFTAQIDNPYWPMLPGTTWVYEGDTDEGFERIVVTVSHRTRMVMGVACRIVLDRAYVDGELIEETFDWYAQDSDSNIWYFGEESYEIEDGVVISTEGSWEAGVDGAQPGIVMLVDPRVGDSYRQEYYEGEAEDMAEVSALDATLTLSDGTLHSNALQTLEWTPLDPGAEENKYYVAGIGMVREELEDGSYPIDLVGMTVDTAPAIDPTNFTAQIDNPYWPMLPGTTWVYEGDTDEGFERIVVTVSHRTRMVMGVACRIVVDRAYLDGELIEETFDWYAQDSDNNIWYFGEESYEIEDGVVISTEGSWEAGVDGAQPGIVMLADPRVGDSYRQEYYEGEAEDMAEVSALDATLTLSDGTLHSNALQTLEWTPLDPGAEENKYYIAGIGMVREEQEDGSYPIDLVGMTVDTAPAIDPTNFTAQIDNPYWPMLPGTTWVYEGDTDEGFERIVVTVSHRTRMVMGVACRIVVDRAYLDGELIEETFDWYAQDSDSNIWYFGEESYEIEDGVVLSMEGSWEAGVDGAQPGIVMLADPRVGDSYRQEYYEGEAEDMAEVSALDATLTLSDGTLHSNALQTLEWTPLDPGAEENKYYIAGIGMVREEQEDGSYPIDLVGMTVDTAPAIDPTNFTAQIDNPYWPMLPGTTWVYEGDTDEGFERIVVTVSHRTRMVMGVACRIVVDRAYLDGELIEETFDWYAQDSDNNIWYFGEESYEIEDGVVISTEGSWEAGVDGAQPGIVMLADPRVGDSYRQEYYEGEAEDMAEVSALDATLTLSDGTLHSNALQTLEWTPLDPGAEENKYYIAGIGMVREEQEDGSYPIDLVGMTVDTAPAIDPTNFTAQIDNPYWPMLPGTTWVYEGDTDEGFERIVVTVSHRTRMVMGVACRIVVDRAYLDGELIEETFDWYAQDSDNNIWYFGEESYEIEDGVVISTEGSWEAGVDGAQPGIVMLADPRVGDSYRQEYYEGEAEDMAEVSALDATLTLSDGTLHSNALQTLEWTPLEPGAEENKYYIAGIGMVREEQEDGSYPIDLVGMTNAPFVSDFADATLSWRSIVGHRYQVETSPSLTTGMVWTVVGHTDGDGTLLSYSIETLMATQTRGFVRIVDVTPSL